jgi:hypothetical protein
MIEYKDPWGFSKLDTYRKCKAQFMFQYIKKLPSPGNAAMERGQVMHNDIEAYLQGWASELPPPLCDWKDRFDELKSKKFTAEQAIGLDKHWLPLKDWFHKDTWLRAKMDAKFIEEDLLTVIDFKSGKYRVPSRDQIELYAIVGHALHPEAKRARAEFWFLDADDVFSQDYHAEELLDLRKKYEQAAEAIYATQVWSESPSRDCKWCPYSKTRGGPCKY